MRLRAFVLLFVAACGKDTTAPPPDLGPAKVILESFSIRHTDINEETVTLTLKNTGGAGAFYVEFGGLATLPNQPTAPQARSEAVEIDAGYRETLSYVIPFEDVRVLRVFSRARNSASYTRTDCQYVNGTRC